MNRIQQIADEVGKLAPSLIMDLEDRINDAATAALESAREARDDGQEKKAVVSIGLTIKWDLDALEVDLSASVSARTKATAKFDLEDPNQTTLPIEGGGE
jgi:hypothetical protein